MTDINPSDIEALIRSFDESNWDEARVVVDGLELYLSKTPGDRPSSHPVATRSTEASAASMSPGVTPIARAAAPAAATSIDVPEGMVVVRAPNLGTFYRAPKPGAPPYVTVGQTVEVGTEICLIEVMKLFTSVSSRVRGKVWSILVEDSQLVEYDQPLFVIDPGA